MKFLCTCIVGPTKKEYTMRDNRIIPHYKTSLPSFHSGLQTTLRVRPVRAPIAAKARAAAHTTPIAERGVLHTSHTMASYPEKDSCCFATEWLQGDGLRTHTHADTHIQMIRRLPWCPVPLFPSVRTSIGFRRHHPRS